MTNKTKKSDIKKVYNKPIAVKSPKMTTVNLGVKTRNGHTQRKPEHGSFKKAFSSDPRPENTSDTWRIQQRSQTLNKEYTKRLGVKTPKTTNVKLGFKTANGHTKTAHEHGSFGKAFSSDPRPENTSDT